MAIAGRHWVTPSGSRYSCRSASPGWIGDMIGGVVMGFPFQWSSTISMNSGPASVRLKQIRHCWLMRMLWCPARSPFRFSSRFPGGTPRSPKASAASRTTSLRRAILWVPSSSFRTRYLCQTRSVSLSRNDRITSTTITGAVNNDKRCASENLTFRPTMPPYGVPGGLAAVRCSALAPAACRAAMRSEATGSSERNRTALSRRRRGFEPHLDCSVLWLVRGRQSPVATQLPGSAFSPNHAEQRQRVAQRSRTHWQLRRPAPW